jgi:hypothetical protein
MTVEIDGSRMTKALTYDTDLVQGDTIHVTCTNPNDLEDISNPPDSPNDGTFNVTFPEGYSGECQVVVTGSDGGEDTGTIEV